MLLDLCLNDIDFDKVPVTCYSSRGSPFTRWIGVGMPRVPDKVLNCTFYLYESKKAAEQGEAYGGTGFLVTVLSQRFSDIAGSHSVYAVTNRHVAVRGGFSVIRINTYEGVEIFETDPSDWTVHPDGDDIAVFPLLLANPRNKGAVGIAPGAFGTKEQLAELDIGVGDNVFMIGRFVDHDGGPVNRPAARFGNISGAV